MFGNLRSISLFLYVGLTISVAQELYSCYDVQQAFAKKGMGSSHLIPGTPVAGENLKVCSNSKTCCTKRVEEKFLQQAKLDFRNSLELQSAYTKFLISANSVKYQEDFDQYLVDAEENTNKVIRGSYPNMAIQADPIISKFFTNLASYVEGKEVDIPSTVMTFFDELFPLVYVIEIHSQSNLPMDYRECLSQATQDVNPFGETPQKIAVHIQKSLQAARVFIQALNLGIEVINTTDYIIATRECSKALLKLRYCNYCNGLPTMKPCNSFCLNVMKGCLANVVDIDSDWRDYIHQLNQHTKGMRGIYNIQEIMSQLDDKISDAIMYAMHNGPMISGQVRSLCGHPPRQKRSEGDMTYRDHDNSEYLMPSQSKHDLYERIQTSMAGLSQSKLFYKNLAEKLCSDDDFAWRVDYECWNGVEKGRYDKQVVGDNKEDRYTNPEMRVSRQPDQVIQKIFDKLRHIQQLLKGKSAAPGEDFSISGSGDGDQEVVVEKGSGCQGDNDDDDCDGSGGSGDGIDKGVKVGNSGMVMTTQMTEDFSFEETSEKNKVTSKMVLGRTQRPSCANFMSTSLVTMVTSSVFIIILFCRW
ncbi:glypican-5-like [Ptychodera flava]|uniref:glypican-5-like n=1 Tax=Ptychodera flava TaxID=63121 RepID=UPI00396A1898